MNNGLYFRVLKLLKMFENRPHHLAKFIIDNDLFSDEVIEKLEGNPQLSNDIELDFKPHTFFKSIREVEQYYENILSNESIDLKFKIKSLEEQLQYYIEVEDYIKAAELNNQINILKIKFKK